MVAELDFDPDALRDKYRAERDQRLRPDGNDQYVEMEGTLAHYLDDPYVEPGFTRAPLTDEVEVVIVGGGFGGLLAGARGCARPASTTSASSRRAATSAAPGTGTAIPGAACDIESYIYLPLLEETGYMPIEKYARAPEILAHSRSDRPRSSTSTRARCFQTEVTEHALGRRRRRAGSSRPTAATACGPASWSWRAAR